MAARPSSSRLSIPLPDSSPALANGVTWISWLARDDAALRVLRKEEGEGDVDRDGREEPDSGGNDADRQHGEPDSEGLDSQVLGDAAADAKEPFVGRGTINADVEHGVMSFRAGDQPGHMRGHRSLSYLKVRAPQRDAPAG